VRARAIERHEERFVDVMCVVDVRSTSIARPASSNTVQRKASALVGGRSQLVNRADLGGTSPGDDPRELPSTTAEVSPKPAKPARLMLCA
jgi:hypothetical protein